MKIGFTALCGDPKAHVHFAISPMTWLSGRHAVNQWKLEIVFSLSGAII